MTTASNKTPILVIEDSREDYEVLERAFRKAGFEVPLHRCKNGEEATNLLYREEAYEFFPKDMDPAMILLDLNMPGMDGHTLLENVKDDTELKHIPIVVLSTSSNIDDVNRSYRNGANCYIQKPEDMSGYIEMVKEIQEYWFGRCQLPAQSLYT